MWMPCSRSGQSYPEAAPPQALMKLPAGSNTITGGAAIAACSGFTVRGRCSSQTLSCASMAKLEASPSFHFSGTLGHDASTSNFGKLRSCASAAVKSRHVLAASAAMSAGRVRLVSCIVSSRDRILLRSGSNGQ
jgi:hypothetical protein